MDIAEIGFKAETSELEKATASLSKLKAAAGGVATATNKVDTAVTSSSLSVARAKTAEANAVLKVLQATKNANKTDLQKASSALKVAKAEEAKAKSLHSSAMAAEKLTKSTLRVIEAEKKQGMSRRDVNAAAGGVANDNMPNRFNTANVAAQFQDIGVTAAMGMNPLTIALQQGTQLSAILNSMKNPLQGLKAAFMSVINPVSLLSIGLVALVAAGIQMVDWSKFAKNSLNGLANAIEAIGPYALGAAAGLALFFAPAIISGLATLTTAIVVMGNATLVAGTKMAAAWVLANPVTMLAALAAALGAIAVWAVKASKPFREFANVVIGIFKGMGLIIYGGVVSAFELINNAVGKALNELINAVNTGLDQLPASIKKKLDIGNIEFKFQSTNFGAEKMREGGKIMADSLKAGFSSEIDATDFVGQIGTGVDNAIGAIASKFREWGSAIGGTTKAWGELVGGAERTIATLRAEGEALTMNSLAAAQLRYETQLLNEAKQKGITLDDGQKSKIEELSTDMAILSEKNRVYKESLEFNKSAVKGFFTDMKSGLSEGMTAWEAFGNAVSKVLDKLLDRMLDTGIDMLFNSLGSAGGANFGGAAAGGGFSTIFAAKGRSFDQNGMQKFAKGGSFTNSTVNKPTPFTFADGGAFGVMGEAGPEAVMPLKRGPDGTLGVQVMGSKSSSSSEGGSTINNNITVNVENTGRSSNEEADTMGRKIAKQIDVKIQQEMTKFIIREKKSGGALSGA